MRITVLSFIATKGITTAYYNKNIKFPSSCTSKRILILVKYFTRSARCTINRLICLFDMTVHSNDKNIVEVKYWKNTWYVPVYLTVIKLPRLVCASQSKILFNFQHFCFRPCIFWWSCGDTNDIIRIYTVDRLYEVEVVNLLYFFIVRIERSESMIFCSTKKIFIIDWDIKY